MCVSKKEETKGKKREIVTRLSQLADLRNGDWEDREDSAELGATYLFFCPCGIRHGG